jgi:hypothetical protein
MSNYFSYKFGQGLVLGMLFLLPTHHRYTATAASFENFTDGTINQQFGWTVEDQWGNSANIYDQAITLDAVGTRVWQMSNAITSQSFSNQPCSPITAQVAGEPGSSLWNDYGPNFTQPFNPPHYGANATVSTFYTRVMFGSATGAPQPGLALSLSATAKQSTVRMSWVGLQDSGSGIDLGFFDYVDDSYRFTEMATNLSYTDLHTVETTIDFMAGPANDVVKVFLNGTLIHTGLSWEAFYYSNEQIVPGEPRLQAVNALLFVARGTAAPATTGAGYYFHAVEVSNIPPTPAPTATPTAIPTAAPTASPTAIPTAAPTASPTAIPTAAPTATPTAIPTAAPTASPTAIPTAAPTASPTAIPTAAPTASPTAIPTAAPTASPTPSSFTPAPTPAVPQVTPTPEGQDVAVPILDPATNTTSGGIEFANVTAPGITVRGHGKRNLSADRAIESAVRAWISHGE